MSAAYHKGSLWLYIWTFLFFVSFWLIMWSWKWQIPPLAKAGSTFGGIASMFICYRFGIDGCLRRMNNG